MADIQAFLGRVLSQGLQRTNRYRCKLDLTDLRITKPGLQEAITLLKEGLLCRTTTTPSRTLETTSVNLAGGYEETYAVGTTYNNLDCTFLCPLLGDPDSTATNSVLTLFHTWQNLIQNRGTGGEDADMVLEFPSRYRLAQGMTLEMFTGRVPKNVLAAEASALKVNRLERDMPDLNPEHLALIREGIASQMVVNNTRQISTAFEYFDVYPVTVSGTTVDWLTQDEMMEVAVSFSYTHWQQVKDGDLNS